MSVASPQATAGLRRFGMISKIAGISMMVAGAGVWITVTNQLKAEDITIPDDAIAFGGKKVNGPLDAFVQADIINKHALDATGGKTYAELDKEDPTRAVAMNASFLRASLFTSVVSYGVALFAFGMGVLWTWLGVALRKISPAGAA